MHPPSGFKRRPRVLSEEEAEAVLAAFNDRYWTPHRDRLACRLMYEAGLRVSEALAVRDDHIEATPSGGEIVVRAGKGGKDRTVGIGRDLLAKITPWQNRRAEKAPATDWLFPTRTGSQLTRQHLHRSVKRAAHRADLPEAERLSPHTLRHSFATRFLKKETGTLEDLRRALGHASLDTTQKYLQLVDDAHVRAMQEQANGTGDQEAEAEDEGLDPREEIEALERRLAALKEQIDNGA